MQAEITSCGLNGKPLEGIGRYSARIACNLMAKEGTGRYDVSGAKRKFKNHPYFVKNTGEYNEAIGQYIKNMQDGAVCGFKYFSLDNTKEISVEIAGLVSGKLEISVDESFVNIIGTIDINKENAEIMEYETKLKSVSGVQPLYFRFLGEGKLDFISFELLGGETN